MAKKLAYYSFRYLYGAIENLKKDIDHSQATISQKLSIYIFTALTYESFLNHAGHYVCQTWDAHLKPKLSPEGKMAFLCEVAKIDADFGKSPFQTFSKVMKLRNKLAHAETEYLEYDEEKHSDPKKWPKPEWLNTINQLDAKRTIKDLEEIISLFEKALDLMPVPSLLYMETIEIPDSAV